MLEFGAPCEFTTALVDSDWVCTWCLILPLWTCSTGWLSHWGEVMANTSAGFMLQTLSDILSYANGTGSVNFYMAHGGSNFGYWAGARPFPCFPHTSVEFCLEQEQVLMAGGGHSPGLLGHRIFHSSPAREPAVPPAQVGLFPC